HRLNLLRFSLAQVLAKLANTGKLLIGNWHSGHVRRGLRCRSLTIAISRIRAYRNNRFALAVIGVAIAAIIRTIALSHYRGTLDRAINDTMLLVEFWRKLCAIS